MVELLTFYVHTFQQIAKQSGRQHCQALLSLIEIIAEGQGLCHVVMHLNAGRKPNSIEFNPGSRT